MASAHQYRIGGVSRLAGVPVSTLRIWESRYGAFEPAKTGGRHRLYSEPDVLRAGLLRRLTEAGHSIGQIARLPAGDLQQLMAAFEDAGGPPASRPLPARLTVGVVGGIAARVTQVQAAQGDARMVLDARLIADNLDDALAVAVPADGPALDLLLVRVAAFRPRQLDQIVSLRSAVQARHCVVLYSFAAASTIDRLRQAGIIARREPIDDAELAQLVASVVWAAAPQGRSASDGPAAASIPPRRYSDDQLASIANSPSSVLCECPRHLAEIIGQLTSFEDYSAACLNDNEQDARLHAHLRSVAGSARAMFEGALALAMAHERSRAPAA